RRDVATTLLVGAEGQQRRTEHVEADDVGEFRCSRRRELLIDDDLLGDRPAAAAELHGPCAADVAGLVAAPLPGAQRVHPRLERSRQVRRVRPFGGEERPDLVLELALGIGGGESHELRSYQVPTARGRQQVGSKGYL